MKTSPTITVNYAPAVTSKKLGIGLHWVFINNAQIIFYLFEL